MKRHQCLSRVDFSCVSPRGLASSRARESKEKGEIKTNPRGLSTRSLPHNPVSTSAAAANAPPFRPVSRKYTQLHVRSSFDKKRRRRPERPREKETVCVREREREGISPGRARARPNRRSGPERIIRRGASETLQVWLNIATHLHARPKERSRELGASGLMRGRNGRSKGELRSSAFFFFSARSLSSV